MPKGKSRYTKRKPMRSRRGKGAASANAKTIIKAHYKTTTALLAKQSSTGVGAYMFSCYSPQNREYYNINSSPEFLAQCKMFDEFKVTQMKVTFKPYANVGFANNSSSIVLKNQLYTVIDRDGNVPISTSVSIPDKLQEYDSLKVHDFRKAWSRVVKVKGFWSDCNNATVTVTGNNGLAQPWVQAGCTQVLALYGEYLPFGTDAPVGQMEVNWSVCFRGKKPTAFAYDPLSGALTMVPISSLSRLVPQNGPQTIEQTIPERLEVDASGNIVFVSDITNEVAKVSALEE